MKVLFLIGNTAVGKRTVGQQLTKFTDLRLFHNHMTIEPVIELSDDKNYRCESFEGEILFENYIKIDNLYLAPDVAANKIKEQFNL
ncbi:MAG: hypothetical protein DBY45_04720 [Clostridiales bacterium]|nr:MAG: hypothetical protein DBY45_04720 [Clostridiales bacterium]